MAGRPQIYDRAIADRVLERLLDGATLRQISDEEGMPSRTTVAQWIVRDTDGFAARYRQAREAQAHLMADELIDLADEADDDSPATIAKAKLQVETRKWVMSRVLNKLYGDKLGLTDGDGGALTVNVVKRAAP